MPKSTYNNTHKLKTIDKMKGEMPSKKKKDEEDDDGPGFFEGLTMKARTKRMKEMAKASKKK